MTKDELVEKKAFLAGFNSALAYAYSDEHEPDPATAWRNYVENIKPFEDDSEDADV